MVIGMGVVGDTTALLLAHQGGWDETLLVLTPVVVIAALLHRANRRAKQHLADRAPGDPPAADEPTRRDSGLD